MIVIVNGEEQALEARTLDDLLGQLDYEGEWLATAVNGVLVPRDERARFNLNAQDRIEILSPMQGG